MSEVMRYLYDEQYPGQYSARCDLVPASAYDDTQSELSALREALAKLQNKHDRTESALNGSMKALIRVDNMWKKRWLDKTGEPAISLIVDVEFKALFEEIKGLKHSLAAAEQRNAELVELLDSAFFRLDTFIEAEREMPIPSMEVLRDAILRQCPDLNPTESGASE